MQNIAAFDIFNENIVKKKEPTKKKKIKKDRRKTITVNLEDPNN